MSKNKLTEISAALHEEEQRLLKAQQQLQSQIDEYGALLKRVRAAQKPLSGGGRAMSKPNGGKPAPSRAVVAEIVAEVRQQLVGATSDQLKEAVEQRVKARGFTLSGFALRFKEVTTKKPNATADEPATPTP